MTLLQGLTIATEVEVVAPGNREQGRVFSRGGIWPTGKVSRLRAPLAYETTGPHRRGLQSSPTGYRGRTRSMAGRRSNPLRETSTLSPPWDYTGAHGIFYALFVVVCFVLLFRQIESVVFFADRDFINRRIRQIPRRPPPIQGCGCRKKDLRSASAQAREMKPDP